MSEIAFKRVKEWAKEQGYNLELGHNPKEEKYVFWKLSNHGADGSTGVMTLTKVIDEIEAEKSLEKP